jgi:hypothetical protein
MRRLAIGPDQASASFRRPRNNPCFAAFSTSTPDGLAPGLWLPIFLSK